MKISKNLLAAVAVTTVVAGGIIGVSAASAQGANNNPRDQLVTKLAEKFGVEPSAVQSVFDEQKAEHEQEVDTKRSEHLQSLVDAGTLTADQKTALEAKFDEMHTLRESLKNQNLTREEIHTRMEDARNAFESWAKEQGINLDSIRPERGKFGHGMHHEIE